MCQVRRRTVEESSCAEVVLGKRTFRRHGGSASRRKLTVLIRGRLPVLVFDCTSRKRDDNVTN